MITGEFPGKTIELLIPLRLLTPHSFDVIKITVIVNSDHGFILDVNYWNTDRNNNS